MTQYAGSIYRKLFEQSAEGMILSNKNGKICEANHAAAEVFGYESIEELLECSISDLIPKPKREKHTEHIKTFFSSPSKRQMGEGRDVEGIRKDGSIFPAEISLNHFTMENGEKLVASFVTDITSRIHYQKQKDKLLFDGQEKERKRVSKELHDGVTQLLGGIKMNLNVLSGESDSETVDKLQEMTEEAVQEARALSHDLMPPDLQEKGAIIAIKDMLTQVHQSNAIETEFSEPKDNERHSSSFEITLFRVCQEAVQNAVKHADANTIKVNVKKEGEGLQFAIQDDGGGFNKAELDQQVRDDGSGMGMANLQERMRAFDGKLSVWSEPDNGTLIQGYLPFEKQPH